MGMRPALLLAILGAVGCGKAVTAHRVDGPRNAYEIECLKAPHCKAKAQAVCGGGFQVVAEWEHPIVLSDAHQPGRDYPRLASQEVAEWETRSSLIGPSDVATAPPLHRLDVVCAN